MNSNKSPLLPVRYLMVFNTFILAMIVLFDRIMISVAKDPIAADLMLSDKQMGWVLSIFALGYALFQTPSGYLADKYGARKILASVVTLWSVFTALTGAVYNFFTLLVVRFIFGAGEAGAFPSMSRAIFSWIPIAERGIVNGINFSGGRIGAAIALPLAAWLIDLAGWRMSFVILGAIGVVWALIWYAWFRDNPASHPQMGSSELAFIESNTQKKSATNAQSLDVSGLLKSSTVWQLMGQYFCSNFTFFFTLTWLFPHIKSTYGLEALAAGFYSSIPLISGALGNWASGFLVDFIYKKGRWSLSRKLPAIVGFVLAAIGIIASAYMNSVEAAILFISIAVFGADMTLSPSWSACIDVGKEHSGIVSGTMNMAGNLGSFVTALAFPYMLSMTGTPLPFFYLAAILNIAAIFIWLKIKPQADD